MFESPLEALIPWLLAFAGIIVAFVAITEYMAGKKPVLQKQMREQFLRALHEQGEVEIFTNNPRKAHFTGELDEARSLVRDLMDEGIVAEEKRPVQSGRKVETIYIYSLTPKGVEEVTKRFGSPPKSPNEESCQT